MQTQTVLNEAGSAVGSAARLHYLDWLRVIAVLAVTIGLTELMIRRGGKLRVLFGMKV